MISASVGGGGKSNIKNNKSIVELLDFQNIFLAIWCVSLYASWIFFKETLLQERYEEFMLKKRTVTLLVELNRLWQREVLCHE